MADSRALLLACLKQKAEEEKIKTLSALSEEDWQTLLDEASRHGLVPFLFQSLKPYLSAAHIPPHFQDLMRSVYYASAARNMRLYHQLGEVVKLFNDQCIPVILLKGAHLAGYIYDNMALRQMVDIDLLVKNEDLGTVHHLLLEEGYSTSVENSIANKKHLSAYMKKNSIPIEIHFQITDPPLAERIDISALWARAEKESLEGAEVLTLSVEDLFMHLCLHTCIHNAFDNGLVTCLDIAQIVTNNRVNINWEQLWNRAEELGIERAVYLLLALADKIIGLPIPEQIDKKIQLNGEVISALEEAENMIFERGMVVTTSLARMFEKRGWRKKILYLKARTSPTREAVSARALPEERKNLFQKYQLYLTQIQKLYKEHGKTVLLGLRGDPQTLAAIELQNRQNNLRDWLMHAE